jgi:hypothetical protein
VHVVGSVYVYDVHVGVIHKVDVCAVCSTWNVGWFIVGDVVGKVLGSAKAVAGCDGGDEVVVGGMAREEEISAPDWERMSQLKRSL